MSTTQQTSGNADPFDLKRFVLAQEKIYPSVILELQNASKQSHWMWFIFPQLEGLGTSPMAMRYAIRNLAEAGAYLQHPLLGQRLLECTNLLLQIEGKSAYQVLGSPDDRKLQSCMTLFSIVSPTTPQFEAVLAKYYNNQKDTKTLELLGGPGR